MKECMLTPEQIREICDRYPNELTNPIATSMGITESQIYRIRKIYDLRKSPECRKLVNKERHRGGTVRRKKETIEEHLDVVIKKNDPDKIKQSIAEIEKKLLTNLSVEEFESLTLSRNSLILKLQR